MMQPSDSGGKEWRTTDRDESDREREREKEREFSPPREGNVINNRGGVVRFSVTPQQASRR